MLSSNHKMIALFVVIVAFGLVSMAFVANGNMTGSNSNQGQGNADAQWLHHDLKTLKGESTIIVVGQVTGINTAYGTADGHTIDTVFVFQTTSYVKGIGPSSVFVTDSGGTLNGATFQLDGNPPLTVGQTYLLFLSSDWTCAPSPPSPPCLLPPTPLSSTFHIVGGPEGKFQVANGLVYSYSSLFPDQDKGLGVDVNGQPIDSFLKQVTSA